jgi:hypothetical protein
VEYKKYKTVRTAQKWNTKKYKTVRTAQKWNTKNTRQSEQLKIEMQKIEDSQNSSKVEYK